MICSPDISLPPACVLFRVRTFTPNEDDAYYDVVPFQMRFAKIKGVVDFYETFARAFPDFQITVHTENDLPGSDPR